MNLCNHLTLHPNSLIYEHGMMREEIAFADLTEVSVVTNDKGPFEMDVFVVLRGTQTEIVIPQDAENFDDLFEVFKKLAGFNYEEFIAAQSSVEEATFVCWQRR